jgi:predicted negative regulator of RcsB-dependent stress response
METIQQDDVAVVGDKIKNFWMTTIRPYEGQIWGVFLIIVVVVVGGYWWRSHKNAQISDANYYLSSAKTNFDSGFSDDAMVDLTNILPGGSHAIGGVSEVAEIVKAKIAYASGEYENAITILTSVIPRVPKTIKDDLQYQLAQAQESNGDGEAALQTLELISKELGTEPDPNDHDRKASVWDRYYYRYGRVLAMMGKSAEAEKVLLKINPKSDWSVLSKREISWLKLTPGQALPNKFAASPNPAG